MQIDFHYYLVYALAKEARYPDDKAEVIAYSSQYVDDNKSRYYVVSDDFGRFYVGLPKRIYGSPELAFPIATQGEEVACFDLHVQRYEYCPFHFIPGDNKLTIQGRTNPLSTEAGCSRAETLVRAALTDDDHYRLGVSLHTYADTWSHHAFSAFHEDWNCVKGNPLPNIGHAEVRTAPDEISTTWRDDRLNQNIVNQDRALQALKSIFNLINKGSATWPGIEGKFQQFIGARDSNARIKLIRSSYGIAREYDEDQWINLALAFKRNTGEIPDQTTVPGAALPKPQYVDVIVKDEKSHWFRFQHAAKIQLAEVLKSATFI